MVEKHQLLRAFAIRWSMKQKEKKHISEIKLNANAENVRLDYAIETKSNAHRTRRRQDRRKKGKPAHPSAMSTVFVRLIYSVGLLLIGRI